MNPVTIVDYPEKSREAIRIIAEHNTAGDTAAFGLESADPVVAEENHLLVSADECLEAVRVVNEVGGWRPGESPEDAPTFGDEAANRLPKLLPGINLVHGLKGESAETFEHNKQFLQRVLDEGLMLRRINIRQVMTFEGTEMAETGVELAENHKQLFKQYKTEVREDIDNPMLNRVVPPEPSWRTSTSSTTRTARRSAASSAPTRCSSASRASANSDGPSTWRSPTTATAR